MTHDEAVAAAFDAENIPPHCRVMKSGPGGRGGKYRYVEFVRPGGAWMMRAAIEPNCTSVAKLRWRLQNAVRVR